MTETIALILLSSLIGFFIRISLTVAKQSGQILFISL